MRASCLMLLSIVLSVVFSSAVQAEVEPIRPNILLIFTDDMGYGDLGCYGSTQIPTPNIDALAANGIRFTQAYVTYSVCAPSRAGLLTGRYQNRFGFEHNLVGGTPFANPDTKGLPKEEVTVAERLQAAGYATHIIGKWHQGETGTPTSCGWHPLDHGFDTFFGTIRGHHNYFPNPQNSELMRNREQIDVTSPRVPYLTDWFTLEAIDIIKTAAIKDMAEPKPWFIYLSYTTPHTPMQAREDDLERFAHIKNKKRRAYAAMQHRLDVCVGQIVEALREVQELDTTLIVFTNDNGGPTRANASNNAPLRGQKGSLLEGGIRVPMIAHWPKDLPSGKTYEQPVMTFDLVPTFLAAASGDLTDFTAEAKATQKKRKNLPIYDGVNLLPYLRGQQSGRPHQQLFWSAHFRGAVMRDGDLKLVRLPDRPAMLFDLSKDITESRDIAGHHPEKVRQMLKALWDWECSFESAPRWSVSQRWPRRGFSRYDNEQPQTQPATGN